MPQLAAVWSLASPGTCLSLYSPVLGKLLPYTEAGSRGLPGSTRDLQQLGLWLCYTCSLCQLMCPSSVVSPLGQLGTPILRVALSLAQSLLPRAPDAGVHCPVLDGLASKRSLLPQGLCQEQLCIFRYLG